MYLKSIEVQGFKSFANKIVFDFHNGITGIVGPNGSGKSNVADAVRWVLGEQSAKQLRGASMQDVIFAGTENRKPLSYAYVAITMDNSDHQLAIDFEEVTVARRVYRSGESEYLINGSPCRLKDVTELFYDTGIGKEGYSIIGQGQIERILSGKPEERRELFDEAAGIVKYKKRKATAQKKLENEREKLATEKETAVEQLRNIQEEIARCTEGIEKGKNEIIELLNRKASVKARQQRYDTMMEQVNIRKAQLTQRLLARKTEEADLTSVLESYQKELDAVNASIAELKKNAAGMDEQNREWKRKSLEANQKLESAVAQYHKQQSRLESLKNIAERYDGYGNSIRRKYPEHRDRGRGDGKTDDLLLKAEPVRTGDVSAADECGRQGQL